MNKNMVWFSALVLSMAFGQKIVAAEASTTSHQISACPCKKPSLNDLNLSPEQQTKIKAIREQASVVKVMHMKAMLTIHNQLEKLIRIGKLDEIKLDVLLDQKKDIMKTMIKDRILVKQEIYSILTTQQTAKYKQMMLDWEKNNMDKLDNIQDDLGL